MLYKNIAFLLLATRISGLDLNPRVNEENRTCTRTGYQGLCVPESYCNEDHTILLGGDIDDTLVRSKSNCGHGEWCCAFENVATTVPPIKKKEPRCLALQVDKCPWCVKLYRSLKKGRAMFCGGVLIGSKLILTTGTCYKAASKSNVIVEAMVPGAMYPDQYYMVKTRALHDKYNSGTREYDLAMFLLEKEVEWPGHKTNQGACMDLNVPLSGLCYGFGFDANDEIISTKLMTRSGSCTSRGQGADAACGTPLEAQSCRLATGLPILCKNNLNDLIVTGVARSPCMESSAPLGSLQPAASWIEDTLIELGVDKRMNNDKV